mgnify:CR=1 FL=1|jgi:hypothetical protein
MIHGEFHGFQAFPKTHPLIGSSTPKNRNDWEIIRPETCQNLMVAGGAGLDVFHATVAPPEVNLQPLSLSLHQTSNPHKDRNLKSDTKRGGAKHGKGPFYLRGKLPVNCIVVNCINHGDTGC